MEDGAMVDDGTTSGPAGRRNWIIAAGVVVAVAFVVVIAGFAFLRGQPSPGCLNRLARRVSQTAPRFSLKSLRDRSSINL